MRDGVNGCMSFRNSKDTTYMTACKSYNSWFSVCVEICKDSWMDFACAEIPRDTLKGAQKKIIRCDRHAHDSTWPNGRSARAWCCLGPPPSTKLGTHWAQPNSPMLLLICTKIFTQFSNMGQRKIKDSCTLNNIFLGVTFDIQFLIHLLPGFDMWISKLHLLMEVNQILREPHSIAMWVPLIYWPKHRKKFIFIQ